MSETTVLTEEENSGATANSDIKKYLHFLEIQQEDYYEGQEEGENGEELVEENEVEEQSKSSREYGSESSVSMVYDEDAEDAEELEEEEELPPVSVFERLDAPRQVLSPRPITAQILEEISVHQGQIRLCWPKKDQFTINFMPNVILPDGYWTNTNKEKMLLLYCENFRLQFHQKYPHRKPLLLAGYNVAGQRKMVCTTLRPTTLSSPNLSTWEELASFVADHIQYEPLDPPTDLSSRMYSPATVFSKKIGHSFEMGNALCSLLLGRNYNAYNVYGFTTKEITERIRCREKCPFDIEQEAEAASHKSEVASKYVLRPPKELKSRFLQAMEQKDIDKAKREQEKEQQIRAAKQAELEKLPPDELHCRRIHGWVILIPREKETWKPFFIEATTGTRREIDDPRYCAIQSIWNNVNYWVNLQDDSVGLGNLDYNLLDLTKWEHILPGEPLHWRKHMENFVMEDDEAAAELALIMDEKHLDMPEPWSLRINVSHQDVATRFPNGYKKTVYKRTMVEEFSPYMQEDGLVIKIYRFSDLDNSDLVFTEERFENRSDKLIKRTEEIETKRVTEYFERGRDDNVKVHHFYQNDNKIESWRMIEYYYKSRFDCLQLLDHGTLYLTENYVDREDKFYYRHTKYAKRGKPPPGFLEGPRRVIMNVVEKFKRNEEKRASDDIAWREFDFINRQINLKFHYDVGKITASTRTFVKPPLMEMVEGISFKPELTYGYQAEIGAKPPKNSTLYMLLEHQLKQEDDCSLKVRHVEDQVSEFIRLRNLELMQPKLDVGLFNRDQNEEHRLAMIEKERQEKCKKEREIEEELDFIQPYLVRYNFPEVLDFHQASLIREKCLQEFKDLLVNRAQAMQKQFQQHFATAAAKQSWYQEEVQSLPYEEAQQYFKDISAANLMLHLLEQRLTRHKDLAPSRYEALVRYLDQHPKLQILHDANQTAEQG